MSVSRRLRLPTEGVSGRAPGNMEPVRGATEDHVLVAQRWSGWYDVYVHETFSVVPRPQDVCPVEDLSALRDHIVLALTEDRLKAVQAFADTYSVDRECEHGWLPTDRKRDCECWRNTPHPG